MPLVAIRNSLSAALLVLTLGTPALGVEPLRTVALSGTQAPGGAAGEVFGSFQGISTRSAILLALNNHGEVAFVERSFYSEGGGQGLQLIARHDDPAPDTPSGVTFAGFLSVRQLLDDGTAYAGAQVRGPGIQGTLDTGLWKWNAGNGSDLVFREEIAPTAEFNRFDATVFSTAINQQGMFATAVLLDGPAVTSFNNHSIWTGLDSQSLAIVVREGDPAPGLPVGNVFGNGGQPGPAEEIFFPPLINGLGTISYYGRATGPDGGEAIWSTRADGGGGLVVAEGQPAPGMTPAFTFSQFSSFAQNDQNLVAFIGTASRPGPPATNIGGLWKETAPGNTELVLQSGQTMTVGGKELVLAVQHTTTPGFNSQGVLTFQAILSGPTVNTSNDNSLWRHHPTEGFQLIAREGASAPGTEDGVLFGKNPLDHFSGYVLNKAGQIAFAASLRGPGVTEDNDFGIWATDLAGNLRLVIREGDTIDVNDGDRLPDLRVVSALSFAGPASTELGLLSNFNDRGQIAFTARFTDGTSGVFVTDFALIPEPGTWVLGVTMVGLASFRRWSTRRRC